VLGRLVDIGAELFVMAVACVRARQLLKENPENRTPAELADLFCRQSRRRIADAFRSLFDNDDMVTYGAARRLLEGDYAWLEHHVVPLSDVYRAERAEPEPGVPAAGTNARTPEPAGAD